MTIAQLVNQHSFLLGAAVLLGGWLVVLATRRARRAAWLAWIVAVATAWGAFFVMRTAAPPTFASAADVQRAVSAGRPTLVEFYSDF